MPGGGVSPSSGDMAGEPRFPSRPVATTSTTLGKDHVTPRISFAARCRLVCCANRALGCALYSRGWPAPAATSADFPVTIRIDAKRTSGDLKPIWHFFGYDEPNYTYMKDGKKLLAELGQLGGPQVYVRRTIC